MVFQEHPSGLRQRPQRMGLNDQRRRSASKLILEFPNTLVSKTGRYLDAATTSAGFMCHFAL